MRDSDASSGTQSGSVPEEIWQGWVQCAKVLDALALVEQTVARLPPEGRELFRLRFREDRSTADIAAVLNISPTLVRKRVQLLREKLRGALPAAQ